MCSSNIELRPEGAYSDSYASGDNGKFAVYSE